MKQITIDFEEYEMELRIAKRRGVEDGYEKAFDRLLKLVESDMSEEAIKGIFAVSPDDRFHSENIVISWILAKSTSCGASSSKSQQEKLVSSSENF